MLRKNHTGSDRNEPVPAQEHAEPAAPAESEAPDFSRRTVSYVGPSVRFNGELQANEGLTVEGEVDGRLVHEGEKMTIGKQGRVNGEVHARTVEIRGFVDGDVHASELVRLYSSAVITGTVHCERIIMDDGATFNGNMRMNGEAEEPELRDQPGDETVASIEQPKIVKAAG